MWCCRHRTNHFLKLFEYPSPSLGWGIFDGKTLWTWLGLFYRILILKPRLQHNNPIKDIRKPLFINKHSFDKKKHDCTVVITGCYLLTTQKNGPELNDFHVQHTWVHPIIDTYTYTYTAMQSHPQSAFAPYPHQSRCLLSVHCTNTTQTPKPPDRPDECTQAGTQCPIRNSHRSVAFSLSLCLFACFGFGADTTYHRRRRRRSRRGGGGGGGGENTHIHSERASRGEQVH